MMIEDANSGGELPSQDENLKKHFSFMRIALNEAEKALYQLEVPVGCLFVYKGEQILSMGKNNTNDSLSGIKHAELIGIEEILRNFDLIGKTDNIKERQIKIFELFNEIDLYVTIEPCIMCGSLLRQIGIKRVIFGSGNSKFGGNGGILKINQDELGIQNNFDNDLIRYDKKYMSYPDFGREEAIILLRKFYVNENKKSPNPKTREEDGRAFGYDKFPILNYENYLNKEEFIKMYGEERLYRWDRGRDENNDTSIFEGIQVENWFDPLMPLVPKVENEKEEWELSLKNKKRKI